MERFPHFSAWFDEQEPQVRTATKWLIGRGTTTKNVVLQGLYRQLQEFLTLDKAGDIPPFSTPLSPKQVAWLCKTHQRWERVRAVKQEPGYTYP